MGQPLPGDMMVRPSVDVPIGERIRIHRLRRGLSQPVLAERVGRSRRWLQKVEAGHMAPDRLRTIVELAKVLHVEVGDLLGMPLALAPNGGPHFDAIGSLRQTLAGVRRERTPVDRSGLIREITDAWVLRQACRYSALARRLPSLISRAEMTAHPYLLAETYILACDLCLKVGETQLAWTSAALATRAARECDPFRQAIASRRMALALLLIGEEEEALALSHMALSALEGIQTRTTQEALSAHGTLLLCAANAAAQRNDRADAWHLLDAARADAERLGEDANHLWTAFGPTNVALHAVGIAVELGDPTLALRRAQDVNPASFSPALVGRRSRLYLDVAKAHSQRGKPGDRAALESLLAGEKIAPEEIRYQPSAREITRALLRRESRSTELRGLAGRLGVLATS
jgi:transcriptional regulator with XRE-family HTH domain